MKYNVMWRKKATKQLFKLEKPVQRRIGDAVATLADSATWVNVKALTGHECSHRLRVGDYRVLFIANVTPGAIDEIRILDVCEVKKRDERTY